MVRRKVLIHNSKLQSNVVCISGYKHACVAIFAATINAPQTSIRIDNVPMIQDSLVLKDLITVLGGKCFLENNVATISTKNLNNWILPENISKKVHGSLYLLPTILGRMGKIEIGETGGCQIGNNGGKRPLQHMLSVLERFGATFNFCQDKIIGKADKFHPCSIDIMEFSDKSDLLTGPMISGATKTAILAAMATTQGTTKIFNPYCKPDVTELLNFLQVLGYGVNFQNNCIEICRPDVLTETVNYSLMTDISQIMTYITVAIYNEIPLKIGKVTVEKAKLGLASEIELLQKMGIELQFGKDYIYVPKVSFIKPIDIEVTSIGIYSDHQPFFALLLSMAKNKSFIKELVWKNRFSYALELNKLGMNYVINDNILEVNPAVPHEANKILLAQDLRAAAALIIAALKAPYQTTIEGIEHLGRGYDNFIGDLVSLNARIDYL